MFGSYMFVLTRMTKGFRGKRRIEWGSNTNFTLQIIHIFFNIQRQRFESYAFIYFVFVLAIDVTSVSIFNI